jgi:phosphatidylserine decarboxylase
LIRPFASAFSIATDEAELDLTEYQNLNAFFTRKLKPGQRQIDADPSVVVSPVDGKASAFGKCRGDRLLQIKGIEYTLFELLRNGSYAGQFENGEFITLYLSPQDYHRIHAPLDMRIVAIGYMPGCLLPVNSPSVRWIDKLYTQNERIVLYAETDIGTVAMVLVGANCVGSISLTFHDFTTNRPGIGPLHLNLEAPVFVDKGEELARFEMGSTVLILFEKDKVDLDIDNQGIKMRMGQRIGRIIAQGEKNGI